MKTREQNFMLNSILSLWQQIIAIICGLALPRIILSVYGSEVNGLVSSIAQFLSFITLLQGGVGTVARFAYYKPLAEKSDHDISVAYKTISNFFRKFSIIFVIYMLILAIIYPSVVVNSYDYFDILLLVIILGFSSVSEYFFGQASQLLLYSDQRGYIYSITQIVCTILSTIVGIGLARNGDSILLVKLASSIIYTVRPLVLFYFVKKFYKIDGHVTENKNLLKQRNAALVRHIAFYIHASTDIMILTLMTNVLWVSVYTIHRYVVNSLSTMVSTILGNAEVVFGNMIAKNEQEEMKTQIPIYDLLSKMISSICFFTCITLITQFLSIYTANINDAEYHQPMFAIMLSLAEMIYCMGLTYQNVYIAAGHIKDTQWIAVFEAIINLTLSIVLVHRFGIVGVAIGTVAAMTFKCIANFIFMKKNVFDIPTNFIIKSFLVNIIPGAITAIVLSNICKGHIKGYVSFFAWGGMVFCIMVTIVFGSNLLFFKSETANIANIIKKRIFK